MITQNLRKEESCVVKGEVCKEKITWLDRSIIRESSRPMGISLVLEKIFRECLYVTGVRAMGSFKCLITFDTKEDMAEAIMFVRDLLVGP